MVTRAILERLCKDAADPADLTAVYSGLEGNITTRMDLEVGDLADLARETPEVVDLLEHAEPRTVRARLKELEGGQAFLAGLESFLQKYGMRGPSEIDIGRDRWNEDPGSLFRIMLGSIQKEPGAHRAYHRRIVSEGWEAARRMEKSVRRGPFGFARAAIVRRMVHVFRTHMAVREHPKYLLVQFFDMARQAVLQAGDTFVQQGRLTRPEDIWLLEFDEVITAYENPGMDLSAIIRRRQADQKHYQNLKAPRLFTSEGEVLKGQYRTDHLPEGAIPGSPVSGGVVEGLARVIRDPNTEVLNPGEILVAPFTDPGWTPLFINAAGLVMEVGGLMTHGSVVAREYGIPAVVGVIDAAEIFKTGQRLRVNGDGGFIEVLPDGEDVAGSSAGR